jgi:hypothetical protein
MSKVIRVQGAFWGKSFCQLSVIFIKMYKELRVLLLIIVGMGVSASLVLS